MVVGELEPSQAAVVQVSVAVHKALPAIITQDIVEWDKRKRVPVPVRENVKEEISKLKHKKRESPELIFYVL